MKKIQKGAKLVLDGTVYQVAYSVSKGALLGSSIPMARDLSKA